MLMDPAFMKRVEALRETHNKPMIVTSAYRCPEHNSRVSKTGAHGPHTTGMAIDIQASGEDACELLHAAIGHGFSGFGIKQHGSHDTRFIHLDTLRRSKGCPRPRVWTYPGA